LIATTQNLIATTGTNLIDASGGNTINTTSSNILKVGPEEKIRTESSTTTLSNTNNRLIATTQNLIATTGTNLIDASGGNTINTTTSNILKVGTQEKIKTESTTTTLSNTNNSLISTTQNLIATLGTNLIDASGGNQMTTTTGQNLITSTLGYNILKVGANDKITTTSSLNTLSNGSNTLTANSASSTANLITATTTGGGNTIQTTTGTNLITTTSGSNILRVGADDKITTTSAETIIRGKTFVAYTNANTNIQFENIPNYSYIDLCSGGSSDVDVRLSSTGGSGGLFGGGFSAEAQRNYLVAYGSGSNGWNKLETIGNDSYNQLVSHRNYLDASGDNIFRVAGNTKIQTTSSLNTISNTNNTITAITSNQLLSSQNYIDATSDNILRINNGINNETKLTMNANTTILTNQSNNIDASGGLATNTLSALGSGGSNVINGETNKIQVAGTDRLNIVSSTTTLTNQNINMIGSVGIQGDISCNRDITIRGNYYGDISNNIKIGGVTSKTNASNVKNTTTPQVNMELSVNNAAGSISIKNLSTSPQYFNALWITSTTGLTQISLTPATGYGTMPIALYWSYNNTSKNNSLTIYQGSIAQAGVNTNNFFWGQGNTALLNFAGSETKTFNIYIPTTTRVQTIKLYMGIGSNYGAVVNETIPATATSDYINAGSSILQPVITLIIPPTNPINPINSTYLGSKIKYLSDVDTSTSTAIGYGANIDVSNQIVIGTSGEFVCIPSNRGLSIGKSSKPINALDVSGSISVSGDYKGNSNGNVNITAETQINMKGNLVVSNINTKITATATEIDNGTIDLIADDPFFTNLAGQVRARAATKIELYTKFSEFLKSGFSIFRSLILAQTDDFEIRDMANNLNHLQITTSTNSMTNNKNTLTASTENLLTSTTGTNKLSVTTGENLLTATTGTNVISTASTIPGANLIRATASGGGNTIQTTTGQNLITNTGAGTNVISSDSGSNVLKVGTGEKIRTGTNITTITNETNNLIASGLNLIASSVFNTIDSSGNNTINAVNDNIITSASGFNTLKGNTKINSSTGVTKVNVQSVTTTLTNKEILLETDTTSTSKIQLIAASGTNSLSANFGENVLRANINRIQSGTGTNKIIVQSTLTTFSNDITRFSAENQTKFEITNVLTTITNPNIVHVGNSCIGTTSFPLCNFTLAGTQINYNAGTFQISLGGGISDFTTSNAPLTMMFPFKCRCVAFVLNGDGDSHSAVFMTLRVSSAISGGGTQYYVAGGSLAASAAKDTSVGISLNGNISGFTGLSPAVPDIIDIPAAQRFYCYITTSSSFNTEFNIVLFFQQII
jgi:hypothetical protein